MAETSLTRLAVRMTDLDTNGHVRGSAYVDFADHARWLLVEAAGVSLADLRAAGVGPVNLETTIRFHQELLAGDEVDVTTCFHYGDGKTSRVDQELLRPDGTLTASVSSVSGLLDLKTRRLVPRPQTYWERIAARPEHLGLR